LSLSSGTQLGPYEVLSQLGAGGMGEVYRARDRRLGREVALKVLPDSVAKDATALARFEREARALAALSHPGILSLFDVGHEPVPYAVMELLQGETLRDLMHKGPVPGRRVAEIAREVSNALAAAHEKGLIHRDLKPENLFVMRDGRVKVLDFGLARHTAPMDSDSSEAITIADATVPGMVVGTVAYMSPEQVTGKRLDSRSDMFSLGIVLFEMLAGEHPFRGPTKVDTMAAILRKEAPPLPVRTDISPALARTVRRCLAKSPAERFATALEIVESLEALSDTGSGARAELLAVENDIPSIAVLPFADMSAGQDHGYFCDGMAEELINALGRLDKLRVASRTSSFQFKGSAMDVQEIGRRLRVRNVLEGSVRRHLLRLRVTAQVVESASGFQVWSGRFDRELSDIFAIQDEITEQIVKALKIVLSEGEERSLVRPRANNVEAYEFYLIGRQHFYCASSRRLETAREMFRKAVAVDPEYALAYAGISDVSCFLSRYAGGAPQELETAEEASFKAVQLAPELAEAHASRGLLHSMRRRFAEAEEELYRARELDPKLFEAHYFLARTAMAQGKLEQAAHHYEDAVAVREDYAAALLLAGVYRGLGREKAMMSAAKRGLVAAEAFRKIYPDESRPLYLGGTALVILGQREKGLEWLQQALEMEPDENWVLYNVACGYTLAGESEKAMSLLDRAVKSGFLHRDWIEHDADLEGLRSHPRFRELLDSMG